MKKYLGYRSRLRTTQEHESGQFEAKDKPQSELTSTLDQEGDQNEDRVGARDNGAPKNVISLKKVRKGLVRRSTLGTIQENEPGLHEVEDSKPKSDFI